MSPGVRVHTERQRDDVIIDFYSQYWTALIQRMFEERRREMCSFFSHLDCVCVCVCFSDKIIYAALFKSQRQTPEKVWTQLYENSPWMFENRYIYIFSDKSKGHCSTMCWPHRTSITWRDRGHGIMSDWIKLSRIASKSIVCDQKSDE